MSAAVATTTGLELSNPSALLISEPVTITSSSSASSVVSCAISGIATDNSSEAPIEARIALVNGVSFI